MAEEDNPSGQAPTGEENKGAEKPAPKGPDGSEKSNISPAEQARRDAQSEKDKGSQDDLRETVDFLSSREAERARDSYVSDLLTKEAEKFPDVKSDDPMFKYATSKEDVEEIATTLQNRYKDMQQDALRSVQAEPDQGLTDEEIATKETELEKETQEQGRSTFGNFLGNLQRRKK